MNLEEKQIELEDISKLISELNYIFNEFKSPEIKALIMEFMPKLLDYSHTICEQIIVETLTRRNELKKD